MPTEFLNGLFPSIGVFILLCLVTASAAALRGFSGFGSSLVLAPLYSLFMSPTDVLVVILLLSLVSSVQLLPQALRSVRWSLVIALFLPCLLGIPVGLVALHTIDVRLLRLLVAGAVTVMSLVLLAGWVYRGSRGPLQSGLAGITSGVLTAIAGIGGPPVLLYLLAGKDPSPTVLRSVFIVYFALGQTFTLMPLLAMGSITGTQLAYTGALLPVFFVATAVGTIAHQKLARHKEDLIRRISLLFLLGIGVLTFAISI